MVTTLIFKRACIPHKTEYFLLINSFPKPQLADGLLLIVVDKRLNVYTNLFKWCQVSIRNCDVFPSVYKKAPFEHRKYECTWQQYDCAGSVLCQPFLWVIQMYVLMWHHCVSFVIMNSCVENIWHNGCIMLLAAMATIFLSQVNKMISYLSFP